MKLDKETLRDRWPVLLLMLLVIVFFGDILFAGKILMLRDAISGDLQNKLLLVKALKMGIAPLWDPFIGCGCYFLACPYTAVLYPANALFTVFSPEWALRAWWVLHLMVAAVSAYALARHWQFSKAPALLSAISFAFSTFLAAQTEFMQQIGSIVWGPLTFLLISRIIMANDAVMKFEKIGVRLRQNGALIASLAIVLALQILASIEYLYYVMMAVAFYAVLYWMMRKNMRSALGASACLILAGVLAVGLVMPHFIMAMEAVPLSTRADTIDAGAKMTSISPRHWLSFLIPFIYGRPGYPAEYWGRPVYEFVFGTCYVGIVPFVCLGFASVYLRKIRKNPQRAFLTLFLISLTIGSLAMAAGDYTPLYEFLHAHLPAFGHFRFPAKFLLLSTYAFAFLGGLGFQAILECRDAEEMAFHKKIAAGVAAVFALFLLGFGLAASNPSFLAALSKAPNVLTAVQMNSLLRDYGTGVVVFLCGLGLVIGFVFFNKVNHVSKGLLVALAFINLWVISRQVQPAVDQGIYEYKPTASLQKLGECKDYRVYSTYLETQQWIYAETRKDVLSWVKSAGVGSVWITYDVPLIMLGGLGPTQRFALMYQILREGPAAASERIADLMSVRYIAGGAPFDQVLWGGASKSVQINERPGYLPRALLLRKWRAISQDRAILGTLLSDQFDIRSEAVVEPDAGTSTLPQAPSADSDNGPVGAENKATILKDNWNSLRIQANASSRSLLLLTDTWYPGWVAKVDGKLQPIYRTNYAFRGVFIEPGSHVVDFIYSPPKVWVGVGLFLIAAILCGILVFLSTLVNPVPQVVPAPMSKPVAGTRKKSGKHARK